MIRKLLKKKAYFPRIPAGFPPGSLQRCNAIGWNNGQSGMPLLLDANGLQRDPNGIIIHPFKHVRLMSQDELTTWMKESGMVMV